MIYGIRRVTIEEMRDIARRSGVNSLAGGPDISVEAGDIRVNVAAGKVIGGRIGLFWATVWLSCYQMRTQNWRDHPGRTLCECAEAEAIRQVLPDLDDVYLHDEPAEKLLGIAPHTSQSWFETN